MNFTLLEYKLLLTSEDGTRYRDLIDRTFEIRQELRIENFIRVPGYLAGNAPGICYNYYGTSNYTDAMLKVNEISNPFSIEENDVLYMPTIAQIKSFYRRPKNKPREQIKDQYTDPNRASRKDQQRQEFLKKRKNSQPATENVPTNFLRNDEQVFRPNNGQIDLN